MTNTDDTKQSAGHTPEPWDHDMDFIVAPDPAGQHTDIYIAEIAHSDDEGRIAPYEQHEANARRICAAVNACRGLSTDALERGAIAELRHALGILLDAAGDLDAAIDGVTEEFDKERARLDAAFRFARARLNAGMTLELHELLAYRRQIALVWSVDDVLEVRPDLTDEQAWEVLYQAECEHNSEIGVNWEVLERTAWHLFGPAPKASAEEE